MTNIHKKPSIDWKKEFINLWGYFEYLFKNELEAIEFFEDLTQTIEGNAKKSTSNTTASALQNVKDRKICKNLHNFFIKSINRYDKKIENLIFQDNISQIIINVSRDDIAFGGRNKEYRWAIENISASQIWQKYLDEYEDEFPEISNLSTPDSIEEILVLEDEQDENSNYICPNLDSILNSYIIFNGKANNFNVMALPKSKITLRACRKSTQNPHLNFCNFSHHFLVIKTL